MLANVTNPQILTFWEEYERMNIRDRRAFTESTLNKVTAFLDEPMIAHILAQPKTTINFRYIMDNSKILLIKLSPQFEEASRLIGAVIIGKLLMTAFSRSDTSEHQRKQFNLYCDEFHRFASSDFATLISEARKFRISTILSHQTLAQLTEQNRASALAAGNIICFRVSGDDSRILCRSFDTKPTQQIVGEEPVRAPAAAPLSHLVRHSSVHPTIQRFVAEYLMPLESLLKKHASAPHPFGFGCTIAHPNQVMEGHRQLNACFARVMREGRSDAFLPPLALFFLGGAADEESTYVFKKDLRYDKGLEVLVYFLGFYGTTEYYGRPDFLTPKYEQEDRAFLRKMAKTSLLTSRETVDRRVAAFTRMLKALRATLAILAKDPIMVDTGSFRPKLQPRLYSDMEAEIARDLANAPNYTARVKLVTGGEYTINTKPAPESLTGAALDERIEAVKRHCRALGYTRHYTEVMEEIRKRQEYLLGLGDTPDDNVADDGDDPDEPTPGSFTLD